jgi:hypothetical protein
MQRFGFSQQPQLRWLGDRDRNTLVRPIPAGFREDGIDQPDRAQPLARLESGVTVLTRFAGIGPDRQPHHILTSIAEFHA